MKMMIITNENVHRIHKLGYLVAIGPNETVTIKESGKLTKTIAGYWLRRDIDSIERYWPNLSCALKLSQQVYSTPDMFRLYWVYQDVTYDDIVKELGLDDDSGYERWLDVLIPTLHGMNIPYRQTKGLIDLDRLGFKKTQSCVYYQQKYFPLVRLAETKSKDRVLYARDFLDNAHYYGLYQTLLNKVNNFKKEYPRLDLPMAQFKHDVYLANFILQTFIPSMFVPEYISKTLLEKINQY